MGRFLVLFALLFSTAPVFADGVDGRQSDVDAAERRSSRIMICMEGETKELKPCLQAIVDEKPNSGEALEARGALRLLERQDGGVVEEVPPRTETTPNPPTDTKPTPPSPLEKVSPKDTSVVGIPAKPSMFSRFLSPGRLELAALTGLVGLWAGTTMGILTGTNADQALLNIDPSLIVLETGFLGVGLGITGAVGGYLLASVLETDQGHAWSTTAGTTWGTSYAIGLLPIIYDVVPVPWNVSDDLIGGLPLLGGITGAAFGFGLGLAFDPSISEISVMNTGGWIGGVVGLLIGLNLVAWGPNSINTPTTASVMYLVGKTAGLIAGVIASQTLNLTWGETLIADLSAVLGTVLLASIAGAFLISPLAEPVSTLIWGRHDETLLQKSSITLLSASVVAGLALGVVSTTIGLALWHRTIDTPMFRIPFIDIVPETPSFSIVQGAKNEMIPVLVPIRARFSVGR